MVFAAGPSWAADETYVCGTVFTIPQAFLFSLHDSKDH